ncbi:MAG: hypothetical protein LBR26_17130 [Prevotella sp.]|jgi:hypothetical protein|nr:hypothetical protein [Prevotella sp.]
MKEEIRRILYSDEFYEFMESLDERAMNKPDENYSTQWIPEKIFKRLR